MTYTQAEAAIAGNGSTEPLAAYEVHKSYRRGREVVHAVRGVTLVVQPGEVVALFGRSGSGKTTLLNCLLGWEVPDAGEVSGPSAGPGRTSWQATAIVPQRFGLLDELALIDNVALPARLAGVPDPYPASMRALDSLGLAHLAERPPTDVSLGEQQRTTIARALVVDPAFLVADEPTGSLDEDLSEYVLATLRDVCARTGMGLLVASHDPAVHAHTDRIVRMHNGQIAVQGDERT